MQALALTTARSYALKSMSRFFALALVAGATVVASIVGGLLFPR